MSGLQQWFDEWRAAFNQDWTEERLAKFIGEKVGVKRNKDGDSHVFEVTVVGYGHNVLGSGDLRVDQWMLLTVDGTAIPLHTETTVEVIEPG